MFVFREKSKTGKILAIVLPIVAALLASTTIGFCCWRRRAKITKRSLSCKLQETEIVEILSKYHWSPFFAMSSGITESICNMEDILIYEGFTSLV